MKDLGSTGTRTSNFQFTNEQTDATGLVYLRARYYEPSVGRLLSRDVWEGNPNQPMSYNGWLYVLGNPVNWTDPQGVFRWRRASRDQHTAVEDFLEAEYGLWRIQLEYPIPRAGGIPDLIYFPVGWTQESALYPARFLPVAGGHMLYGGRGYVYEIEPYYGQYMVGRAILQATGYVSSLTAASAFLSDPYEPTGGGYDWTPLRWGLGTSPIPVTPRLVPYGGQYLIVWYEGNGAIMYADSRWEQTRPDVWRRLPPPVIFEWERERRESEENRQFGEMARPRIGIPFPSPREQDQEVLRVLLPLIPVVIWLLTGGCGPLPVFQ